MSFYLKFLCEPADGGPPVEKTEKAEAGDLITQVAYRAGVLIQQTCGGTPSCADCKIVVKEGGADAFEKPEGAELRLLGNVFFITHERLACQARVKQDATVFVPFYRRPLKGNDHGKQSKKEQTSNKEKKQKS